MGYTTYWVEGCSLEVGTDYVLKCIHDGTVDPWGNSLTVGWEGFYPANSNGDSGDAHFTVDGTNYCTTFTSGTDMEETFTYSEAEVPYDWATP
jgi:hypothetical protein